MAMASLFLTSCLKDTGYDNQEYQTVVKEVKGVSFPQAKSSPLSLGLVSSSTTQSIDAPTVALEAFGKATQDITVTVRINPTLVTDAGLTPIPATDFVAPTQFRIRAGQTIADASTITFPTTSSLDPTVTYGIGLTIESADGGAVVAENARNILLQFSIKNQWDGVYSVTGSFIDVTNATFVARYPKTYELITDGPTKCHILDPNLNGGLEGYTFFAGTTPTYYGNFGVILEFDAATSKVIGMTNFYGQPSSNGRSGALDPTGINSVAPDKTISVKYQMLQPAVVPSGPRAIITEVMTYVGPR